MGTKTKDKKKKKKSLLAGTYMEVPISTVRPNQYNYNVLDEFGMEKLKATILLDGFVDDIIVRDLPNAKSNAKVKFEIIDGEHRFYAAKELGMEVIPIKNLGKIPDDRARALTIKLNELKGRPDTERLAILVEEFVRSKDEELINTLPFDQDEMDILLETARDRATETPPPSAGGTGDEEGGTRKKSVKDKFDVYTICKFGQMTDDEEEEFVGLLHELENVMGIEKRPFRLLMKVMRQTVKKIKRRDQIENRKKKPSKKPKK
jgi:hypothetical protein